MGWGTFAAGQVIRIVSKSSPRTSSSSLDEGLEAAVGILNEYFLVPFGKSYVRRVVKRSILRNPDVWEAVDRQAWQEDLGGRTERGLTILLAIHVPMFLLLFLGIPLVVVAPITWYGIKAFLIRRDARLVDSEFRSNEWDVDGLRTETKPRIAEIRKEKTARAADVKMAQREAAKERARAKKTEDDLKKFGNRVDPRKPRSKS